MLTVDDDRLRWRGRSSSDLLADLRAHKAEVLALLAANDAAIPPTLPRAIRDQATRKAADIASIEAVDKGADIARWR
jgi:dienelactone hydrolase